MQSTEPAPPPAEALPGHRYALVVLTAINLLNYIDRYVPSATKTLIQDDLHLSDTETSLPLTGFLVVYMVTSPIFGALADRGVSRKGLIAAGVVVWSLATAAGAFSTNFATFMLARMGVGVGEAAYATIAPALLSDYHPPANRSGVLAIFYCAIPVGAAIGFAVGGVVGDHAGWRAAFLVCGLPGLLVALLCWWIREPAVGQMDVKKAVGPAVSWREVVISLSKNRTYLYVVGGSTLAIFGSGGMADWFTTYLERVQHIEDDTASTLIGGVTVIGGFAGTALGSLWADRLKGKTKNPYLFVSAIGLLICTAMSAAVMLVPSNVYLIGFLLLMAQVFLWMYNGPTNALVANCVDSRIRTRAFSVSIFLGHAFGDAISPTIVGAISDRTGSLAFAVTILPLSFALGTIVWLIGWRYAIPPPDENPDFAVLNADADADASLGVGLGIGDGTPNGTRGGGAGGVGGGLIDDSPSPAFLKPLQQPLVDNDLNINSSDSGPLPPIDRGPRDHERDGRFELSL